MISVVDPVPGTSGVRDRRPIASAPSDLTRGPPDCGEVGHLRCRPTTHSTSPVGGPQSSTITAPQPGQRPDAITSSLRPHTHRTPSGLPRESRHQQLRRTQGWSVRTPGPPDHRGGTRRYHSTNAMVPPADRSTRFLQGDLVPGAPDAGFCCGRSKTMRAQRASEDARLQQAPLGSRHADIASKQPVAQRNGSTRRARYRARSPVALEQLTYDRTAKAVASGRARHAALTRSASARHARRVVEPPRLKFLSRSYSSSSERGQSLLSRRDIARSARRTPLVWQRAQ
jgi:hypothetical protein